MRLATTLKNTIALGLSALLAAALVAVGAMLLAPSAATGGSSKAKVREFEGRVLSINRAAKTFVQRRGGGRRVRIRVNRRTRYEDLRGFRALRRGMKVETRARHNGRRWVARHIDRDDRDFDSDADTDNTDNDSDTDSD